MGNFKTLASQTAIYGVSTILSRLLNFLLVPLHVYVFSNTAQYGVVGEMYAWVSLLNVVLTYGMETAYFRFTQNQEYQNKTFATVLASYTITSTLFIILSIIFAQPIACFLHYNKHPEYIIWFAVIIGADALSSIFFAALRQKMKAIKFAVFKIINISTNIILNLFFLILCPYLITKGVASEFIKTIYNTEIGIGYIFISNLIASVITIVLFIPELFKIKLVFSFSLWKIMMVYAMPLLVFNLAGIVNETVDRILLKNLSPPDIAQSQVGIYSACYKISILITVCVQAFKYAAEPFFFKKSKDDDAKQTYSNVMSVFVLFLSFMFLGIMLYIDIVQYFVSENYRVGIKIVPILLLANIFLGIFYNLSIWYKVTDKTRFGGYIALVGACITIILNLILIPVIGYLGSAWATFICYFSIAIISYILGQKYYKVDYKLFKIIYYISLPVLIWLISSTITIDNLFIKYMVKTLFLTLYIVIIYFSENKYIKTILKQ